ncbi:MAG: SH3 domain-containing protein [Coleofasciculus sp. S288]|nr:SH3 domain-containing protein [Coleofasciculus sp. S288]
MKMMNSWGKPITLLVLVSSVVWSLETTATVVPGITSANLTFETEFILSQKRSSVQLTQGLIGQCRAASRSMFVYRERSNANPIRALEPNEQVALAEEAGREGWIAISSPIRGFVEARDLKTCSSQEPRESREPREPRRTPSPPPSSNLCRQVSYEGTEGLAIRARPDANSSRVGGVFFGDRVRLTNPPQFQVDNQGREWVKIAAPVVGWMSNGFPSTGDINLEACL